MKRLAIAGDDALALEMCDEAIVFVRVYIWAVFGELGSLSHDRRARILPMMASGSITISM